MAAREVAEKKHCGPEHSKHDDSLQAWHFPASGTREEPSFRTRFAIPAGFAMLMQVSPDIVSRRKRNRVVPSTERILYELNFRECRLILGNYFLIRLQMREKQAFKMHAERLVITISRQHH